MKNLRRGWWTGGLACSLAMIFLAASLGAGEQNNGDDKKKKKRPKVNKVYIEQARKNPALREIVQLHDGIQEAYNELTNLKAIEDPREARKAKRKIARLETKIARDRRKLEKAVALKTKPLKKVYKKNKHKVDDYTQKAKALEKAGKTTKALQLHQQAAKYSGPMESAKRRIDILEWFLFFDEEEE